MNKYKIIYTNKEETPEEELLKLMKEFNITDGLGDCQYLKNGKGISFREFTLDLCNEIKTEAKNKSVEYRDIIASSGDSAQVASSGDCAQVASSGYCAQVASSGDSAQVASSGYCAKVASSGFSAQVASSGDSAQVASSGNSAQVASSGDSAQVASSGNSAQVVSSGDSAQVASSGNSAQVVSSGNSAQVASSGDSAQVVSSGDSAKVVSSGDYAQHDIKGKNSACFDCGIGGVIKGTKGTHIALCEWYYDNNKWHIRGTATAQIDGKILKENTYYGLYNGKFTEIDFTDDIRSAVIKKRGKVKQVKIIDTENNIITDKISYVVADNNGNFAHGETIKKAKESLIYKISNRDSSIYKDYSLDTIITLEEAIKLYRVITGACEFGTKHFIETNKIERKKYTIKEIIEITKGQFGNEVLTKFFTEKK